MAKISLTKYFPPTTTSVLEINEILRESDKVQFGLSFKTNLGSSQSYVGNGVTYNATLKVSGTGIETQTKTVQLKESDEYWQGTATHTLDKLSWEVNVPSSANSVRIDVTYKYSDEATTMSGSTEITLTKLLNVLNPFSNNESLDLEQAQTLSITQYDSTFTSNLELIVKNNQNQNVTIANFENVEDGQQISLNETQLNALFNATSNQQKYQMFWLLYTLNNGTSIGNTTTQSIGVINNANPIFTDFDFADINPITTAVTSSNQSIVGGVSTLQITIPTTKKATAVKGASIVSYIISDKAIDDSTSEIKKTIPQYNSSKIVVSAVDTRGNTTTVQKIITDFILYSPITINQTSATISRTNNIDEETKISFEGTFWNSNFGKADNSLSVAYKYRLKGSSNAYTTGVTTITPTISNNSFSVTDKAILGDTNNGFDVSKSYEIIVEVSDKLSVNEIDYTLNPGKNAIEIVGNEVVKINDIPFEELIPSSPQKNITLAKMNTYGKQSVASGATAFVTSWTETMKIEIGDFKCDVANGRIKIPAGTAKHIRITGLIAGSGYFFGGCYVLDENNETPEDFYVQSAGILIQSAGNVYFKEPLPTYVHEITDTTKDYYVKLNIGGYNNKTFILNNGFGSLSSYILVEKVD
jgi:hypothetical protein